MRHVNMSYLVAGRSCVSRLRHLRLSQHHEQGFTLANLPSRVRWLPQGDVAEGNQTGLSRSIGRLPPRQKGDGHAPFSRWRHCRMHR